MLFTPPVPEPPPADLPWYRLISAFRTNALGSWPARAYDEKLLKRRFLGRTSLLLNAPDAIRQILVDEHSRFSRTPATIRILRPILGNGLFISEGEAWRHQRRTLAPAFTPKAIYLLAPHIQSATREAIDKLSAKRGRPVNLLAEIQHLTLEIAGRSMFSLEMHRHGPVLRSLVAEYTRRLGRPHLLDFLLPVNLPNPHDIVRRRFRRIWMALIEQIVAERRLAAQDGDENAAPRDLFDVLTRARDPESGAAFSPEQLRDQVATMIMAGHETTAVALFWSLYLLAMAPDIQERVASEVCDVPLHGVSAEPALQRLVYTRAVIDEAMRLYPPAFAIVRAARGAETVCDVTVQRGALMIVAPWVLHRHRRLWRDPDAFDPSRFLPGAPAIDRFAYLPFGVGPRVCIGAHFALTEATLVLASLIQTFRIACADPRPVLPVAVVTTQPDHAPSFHLHPR